MGEGGTHRDFGDYFRNARTENGISRESLSKLTKIPLYHIVSLENSDHESLPECVYVKGFINACCGVLGLSPEEMTAYYTESRQLYLKKIRVKKSGLAYRKTILLTILLLLCIYALNLYLDKNFFIGKKTVTTDAAEIQTEEEIPAAKEKEITLTLQGKDIALVKMIIDGDLPKKIEMTKGSRFDFTAKRNFNLLIENPKNVEISFNGSPYLIPGNEQIANVFFP